VPRCLAVPPGAPTFARGAAIVVVRGLGAIEGSGAHVGALCANWNAARALTRPDTPR
jgi:hypothetical protein